MAERVIIVGAGPTGLTAGVELARRGLLPLVLEKRPTPSGWSRAVGILSGSMRILGPSGVAGRIDAEAVRIAGIVFREGPRDLMRLPIDQEERTRVRALAQDRTEALLAAALERLGGRIRRGAEVTGLDQDAAGVRLTLAGGEVLEAAHAIGADGVHSTVRQALGIAFAGHDLPGRWSIADVDATGWDDPDWFHGYLLPAGEVCVVVPLDRARFRLISSRPDALAALPVPMAVDRVRRAGSFTIPVRQVATYALGRVFLAGDAAHCHSPVGGRGMNLGIADAADLAARLAGEAPLEGYSAARHAAGAEVLALSERGRRAVQSRRFRPLTRTAMRLVDRSQLLRRAAARAFVGG